MWGEIFCSKKLSERSEFFSQKKRHPGRRPAPQGQSSQLPFAETRRLIYKPISGRIPPLFLLIIFKSE